MTYRDYDDAEYMQQFDVENRLVAITDTDTPSVTQFFYDGDGNRVKTIYPDGSWTAFIGDHYEVDDDYSTRSYYFLGGQRVAMRIQKEGQSDQLYFFHTDHLGSTSLLSDESGQYVDGSEARYLPYGEYRVEPTANLTDHGFTGHKQNDSVGLIFMKARYYSPGLGRFLSADSIVPDPGNPQTINRYSYSLNSPINYIDPDGHFILSAILLGAAIAAIADVYVQYKENRANGMAPMDAIYHENLNKAEIAGAAVGGAVSGGVGSVALAAVPAAVASFGITGAAGTAATLGTSAVVGAGANVVGDYTGRVTENFLGSSRTDIYDPDSYKSSMFWGAATGTASGIVTVASNSAISYLDGAERNDFTRAYQKDCAIKAWDSMQLNGGETYLVNDIPTLNNYLGALYGPTEDVLQSVYHPASSAINATSRGIDIFLNDDMLEAVYTTSQDDN